MYGKDFRSNLKIFEARKRMPWDFSELSSIGHCTEVHQRISVSTQDLRMQEATA